uniref:Response regulatory domain-containing protein n=1 Tax=Eiseniibacteriota bacterium TaxID=2212470 RepID=A0A832I275_UNCEI
MTTKRHPGTLLLVHWNEPEARALAADLRGQGWRVSLWTPTLKLSDLKTRPPAAVVISLRRLPSHGREVADALWYTKWGRAIPIVFFDGPPDKTGALREKFPAASFTTWEKLPAALEGLIARRGEG